MINNKYTDFIKGNWKILLPIAIVLMGLLWFAWGGLFEWWDHTVFKYKYNKQVTISNNAIKRADLAERQRDVHIKRANENEVLVQQEKKEKEKYYEQLQMLQKEGEALEKELSAVRRGERPESGTLLERVTRFGTKLRRLTDPKN